MNGLKNGLYNGLENGLNNGLFDGLNNGLNNGLYSNEYFNDLDALNFIVNANINSSIQQIAIKKLVFDLKSNNLWNKIKVIYPFCGGTASSHKYNLKNPADTNSAFRLFFSGGWTHSNTGAKPNGTNAYADTYINSSSGLNNNSMHLSYYSRTNSNGSEVEIGSQQSAGYSLLEIRTVNNTYYLINISSASISSGGAADLNSAAFYLGNRISISTINGFRNSVKLLANTTATMNPLDTTTMYLGAMHNTVGVASFYSTKECAFASIGNGLNDTDSVLYYNIVQNYQTILGRNV